MAPLLYKDIQKAPSDILNNDYSFDKKFKLTTLTANGVTFTTEGVLKPKAASGKFTSKFKVDDVSVDKLSIGTDGRITAEASIKGLVEGAKFGFKIEDGDLGSGAPYGEINGNYANDMFALDSKLELVHGPVAYAAGTFKYENFLLGAEVKLNTQLNEKGSSPQLDDFGGAAAYAGPDYVASVMTKNKTKTINLAIAHAVSPITDVAVNFEVQPSSSKKELTVGGTYRADKDTKFCGKINSNGVVSGNYIQQLSPFVKLIASASVDAKNFNSDSHKFGMQLILG